jgi:hypothetical protein
MSRTKPISEAKNESPVNVMYAHEEIGISRPPEVVTFPMPSIGANSARFRPMHPRPVLPSKIAVVGN